MGSSSAAASEEEMRRPVLCCDSSTTSFAESPCKHQRRGPMARVRRFFASPLSHRLPTPALHLPASLHPTPSFHSNPLKPTGPRCSETSDNDWSSLSSGVSTMSLEHVEDFGVSVELQAVEAGSCVPLLLENLMACVVANAVVPPSLTSPHWAEDPALLPALRHGTCPAHRAADLLRSYLAALPRPLLPPPALPLLAAALAEASPVAAVRGVLAGAAAAPLCHLAAGLVRLPHSGAAAWPVVAVAVAGEGRAGAGHALAAFILRHHAALLPRPALLSLGPASTESEDEGSASSERGSSSASPPPPRYRPLEGGEGALTASCVDSPDSDDGTPGGDVYSALPLPYSIHKPQSAPPERKLSVPSSSWSIISDIETPAESDSSTLLASPPWGTAALPTPSATPSATAPPSAPPAPLRKRRRSKHRRPSSSPSSRESDGPADTPSLTALVADNEPVVSGGRHWAGGEGGEEPHRPTLAWLTPHTPEGEAEQRQEEEEAYDSRSEHDAPYALPRAAYERAEEGLAKAVSLGKSSGQRNVASIKKKIKQFEEEFERKFGYKPSHSEKMKHREIKKYMHQLNKGRKEIKSAQSGVAGGVASLVEQRFPLSLLRCQESTSQEAGQHQDTLAQVLARLRDSRAADGRPHDLQLCSHQQLLQEKTQLQKALLYYESLHGRPASREARQLARPLYDRYRCAKRCVARAEARAKESLTELAPIIEHVVMDFTLASPQHRASLTSSPPSTPPPEPAPPSPPSPASSPDEGQCTVLGNLHSLPPHELRERRREARDNKRRARRNLRAFEERYEREHGCKPPKEDRPIQAEALYRDYKHAKAKLRLLEALIGKTAPREDEH